MCRGRKWLRRLLWSLCVLAISPLIALQVWSTHQAIEVMTSRKETSIEMTDILLTNTRHSAHLREAAALPKVMPYEICKEQQHVIYVRIPRTGSSLVTSLVWRFALQRELTVLVPRPKGMTGRPSLSKQWHCLPGPHRRCDVMANSVVYDFMKFLPNFPKDTSLIGMVREPMKHLVSNMNHKFSGTVNGVVNVNQYLQNQTMFQKLCDWPGGVSPIAWFFGLRKHHFKRERIIWQKISEIENRFALVLVWERLDESLILLRRTLCWSVKDILYFKANDSAGDSLISWSEQDFEALREFAKAEFDIYEYFSAKLQSLIDKEGRSFQQELLFFQMVQSQVVEFCTKRDSSSAPLMFVGASLFSREFTLTAADCQLMQMGTSDLLTVIKNRTVTQTLCGKNI